MERIRAVEPPPRTRLRGFGRPHPYAIAWPDVLLRDEVFNGGELCLIFDFGQMSLQALTRTLHVVHRHAATIVLQSVADAANRRVKTSWRGGDRLRGQRDA